LLAQISQEERSFSQWTCGGGCSTAVTFQVTYNHTNKQTDEQIDIAIAYIPRSSGDGLMTYPATPTCDMACEINCCKYNCVG